MRDHAAGRGGENRRRLGRRAGLGRAPGGGQPVAGAVGERRVLPLAAPLPEMAQANLHASVRDVQGNITRVDVRFTTVQLADLIFVDDFE